MVTKVVTTLWILILKAVFIKKVMLLPDITVEETKFPKRSHVGTGLALS